MGNHDHKYQKVQSGQSLSRYVEGGWVLFQRTNFEDFWLGRTFDGWFMLGPPRPVQESEVMPYIIHFEAEAYRQSKPGFYDPQMQLF